MPEVEGIGEMATGAAWARAVEPRTGEAGGRTQEANCLNCGCALVGPYCHCCGQRGHVHRTIAAWWHDFLHSVLHVDGKFWSTLGILAWRPGDLTRRYVHGERAKFVSPLALFLFTVFLTFAVFSLTGGGVGADQQMIRAGLAEEVRAAETRIATLEGARQAAVAAGTTTSAIDADLAEVQRELSLMRGFGENGVGRDTTIQVSEDLPTWIRTPVEKATENPELLFYKLQANAYKFSWALIPLSVPFVWVLFLHRRRYRQQFTAYDHLVFVTYSIAFMSLALIVYTLLQTAGLDLGGTVALLFLAVPPLHMYRQLRGAYRLSPASAAWRTFVLLNFATVALGLFFTLLLTIGVLG